MLVKLQPEQAIYIARKAEKHGLSFDETLEQLLEIAFEMRQDKVVLLKESRIPENVRTGYILQERATRTNKSYIDLSPEITEKINHRMAENSVLTEDDVISDMIDLLRRETGAL